MIGSVAYVCYVSNPYRKCREVQGGPWCGDGLDEALLRRYVKLCLDVHRFSTACFTQHKLRV
jgi:hypothetical protein